MEEDWEEALRQADPRALGKAVYKLRDKKRPRPTQVQLGKDAGYAKGAGISISRIENGQMKPGSERFKEIAARLDVTPAKLLQEAETEMEQLKREQGAKSIEDRLADIKRFHELRSELINDAEGFERASERANTAFLVRFREVAARVQGAPPPDGQRLVGTDLLTGDDAKVEAAYQLRFTTFGVKKALSESTGSPTHAGKIEDPALDAFASLVSQGSSLLSGTIPSGAATIFGAFQRAAGMKGGAASGIAVLAGIAGVVMARERNVSKAKRSAELAQEEEDIERARPSVVALRESILRATDVLDYVALHASHALNRWETQIGEEKLDWKSLLETGNQQRYFDFAEVAAAQLAVVTLSYDDLWKTRGDELERAKALIDEVLSQAQSVIESHV